MTTARSHSTRTRLLALVAGAAAILLVASMRNGSTRTSRPASQSASSAAGESSPNTHAAPPPGLDPDMLSARALREALAQYERDSIYPPSSHRWTDDTAGQNQRWDRPFPVDGLLDDEPGRETVLRFAGDRHHVQFGGALVSTIEVVPLGRAHERMPIIAAHPR